MSVRGVESGCWILALFIRDDGERLLLGDGAFDFSQKLQHFAANDLVNDTVELQGADGIFLAGQVRRPTSQSFDGVVGTPTSAKSAVEQYRRDFLAFFRKNNFYQVIYVFPDGSAIQRRRGFVVDEPEVKEMWQVHPAYHVALNFEDVNYYTYAEDESGAEVYGQSANIPLSLVDGGGLVWDETGTVFDEVGAVWEGSGGGGQTIIPVDSIANVSPIWVVRGPVVNPVLTNVTTSTVLRYTGAVTSSQTLRIDMANRTAMLNGTNVVKNVGGDWIELSPGNNRVVYSADNADAPASRLEWQEVVG